MDKRQTEQDTMRRENVCPWTKVGIGLGRLTQEAELLGLPEVADVIRKAKDRVADLCQARWREWQKEEQEKEPGEAPIKSPKVIVPKL